MTKYNFEHYTDMDNFSKETNMLKSLIIPKHFSYFKKDLHFLAFNTLEAKFHEMMKTLDLRHEHWGLIEEKINRDFDLKIYHAESLIMHIDTIQKGIFFTETSLEKCIEIANKDEHDIISLYASHGFSYNGEDDFYDVQGFPGWVLNIMKACVDDKSIETLVHF
ncbi:MAG TPA: hypothetical protein VI815_02435 [Candidatus Nanoarchaeia archaeon]|nr:hypothetical protein [Candidatus Nanoarchaeia archaeon]